MHRTSGTILATSRNKVKHLSPPHCFTQARGYNTWTNPLPLLHTGEEDPFPLLHTGERVFTGFLCTKNLTQHLIPPRSFKQGKHFQHTTHENYRLPTTHHHIMHSNSSITNTHHHIMLENIKFHITSTGNKVTKKKWMQFICGPHPCTNQHAKLEKLERSK